MSVLKSVLSGRVWRNTEIAEIVRRILEAQEMIEISPNDVSDLGNFQS